MKRDEENLDDVLDNVDLQEHTEMGEVAENVFRKGAGRTNLSDDEVALCLINDLIFKGLQLDSLNPTDMFMELKKSAKGWSTNKFVEGISGLQNARSGGMIRDGVNALFRQR